MYPSVHYYYVYTEIYIVKQHRCATVFARDVKIGTPVYNPIPGFVVGIQNVYNKTPYNRPV